MNISLSDDWSIDQIENEFDCEQIKSSEITNENLEISSNILTANIHQIDDMNNFIPDFENIDDKLNRTCPCENITQSSGINSEVLNKEQIYPEQVINNEVCQASQLSGNSNEINQP